MKYKLMSHIIYNAPELAKTLKVSKQAIYQAHAAGLLKSSLETPTGRLLFNNKDIFDFLSAGAEKKRKLEQKRKK